MYKNIVHLLLRVGRIFKFQIDEFLQPYGRHLNVFGCKVWALYGFNIYYLILWGTHDIAISLNTDRQLETGEVNLISDVLSSGMDVLEDSFLHVDLWFLVRVCVVMFYYCRSALKRDRGKGENSLPLWKYA